MGLGKFLVKKIPFAGLVYGVGSGSYHFARHDPVGGTLDYAAGITAIIPGWGTVASIGLDIGHMIYDIKKKPAASVNKTVSSSWGLSPQLSQKAATFISLAQAQGLHPSITSGFRSQAKQTELYNRWLAGDRTVYKPLKTVSPTGHGRTVNGQPASNAVDIGFPAGEYARAASIAKSVGLKTGLDFGDPPHFYI
jgi:hypothetical protein